MGASAGRVLLIPKGDWNANTTYTGLDWVRHNGAAWVCKNTCTNIEPTSANTNYWQMMSRDGDMVTADTAMSDSSTNAVQNKVIKSYVDNKISFSDHDTAKSGASFTDAEDGNMLVTDWTKNLLNPTLETVTQNGVTCTNNGDGTYTINGTSTKDRLISFGSITLNPGKYKFIATENNVRVNNLCVSLNGISIAMPGEIFIIQSKRVCDIGLSTSFSTFNSVLIKPMITTDLSATYDDFVPYGGYEIKSCGKNLFHIRDDRFTGEHTYSGVTFTRSDGKLILNGTSTSSFYDTIGYFDYIDGIDKYTFSGWDTSKISPIKDDIGLYSADDFKFDFGNGAKTDATINRNRAINLVFQSGQVFDNFILQPIVIAGHTDLYYSDFEPYTGETITVTNDTEFPAFGLKSYKGITNIISPGNVKCVYPTNESGKGMLDAMYNNSQLSNELSKLKNAIIAMGGTV